MLEILDKTQHPEHIMYKNFHLNIAKPVYAKPTANNTMNEEWLKVFPLSYGIRQEPPLSLLLFNIVLKVLARVIKQCNKITYI